MSVYVGVPMWPYRGWIMCHMFADTDEELELMARRIGLNHSWIQEPRESIGPHYDIAESKRALAIKAGATACDDLEAEMEALQKVEANRHGL